MPGTRNLRRLALAAAFGLAAIASMPSARAGTIVLTISACIDGRDLLLIEGDKVQWQLVDAVPPGIPMTNCSSNATTISTRQNGAKVLDNAQWVPIFDYPAQPGALSSVLAGLKPSLPAAAMQVTARAIQARGTEGIQQLPTSANDYTLILDFDDESEPGAAVYSIEITITTP